MAAVAINDLTREYNEFLVVANEKYLSTISSLLDQLKNGKWQEEISKEIYRLNHLMKNNFKALNLYKLAYASHRFEDLIIKLKNNQIVYSMKIHKACMEFFYRMNEAIELIKINYKFEIDIATNLKKEFKMAVEPQLSQTKKGFNTLKMY